ncbi:MAG TPA: hypothetical protein PKA72_05805, partial [bacterium]|nr:hypothetical protein [bacterium]
EAVRKLQGAVGGITVTQVTRDSNALMVRLEYPNQSDPRKEIFEYAVKQQWAILEMSRHKVSLEDIFRTLTVEGGQPHA